jgi:hypothetical protein
MEELILHGINNVSRDITIRTQLFWVKIVTKWLNIYKSSRIDQILAD